jgi:hypothetical protein
MEIVVLDLDRMEIVVLDLDRMEIVVLDLDRMEIVVLDRMEFLLGHKNLFVDYIFLLHDMDFHIVLILDYKLLHHYIVHMNLNLHCNIHILHIFEYKFELFDLLFHFDYIEESQLRLMSVIKSLIVILYLSISGALLSLTELSLCPEHR